MVWGGFRNLRKQKQQSWADRVNKVQLAYTQLQSDAATNAKMSTEAVFTLGNKISVKWTTVNTGVKFFELVHFWLFQR